MNGKGEGTEYEGREGKKNNGKEGRPKGIGG